MTPPVTEMDGDRPALGTLLELLHGAHAPFTTVQATYRTWGCAEGQGAALEAEIKRQKPSRLQTELEFRRRAASTARPLFIGTPARHEHEEILRIWRAGDRVREERAGGQSDGAYGVIVGDLWWYWDPRYGVSSNEDDPKAAWRTGIGRELAVMLNPIVMLSELRFAVAGRSEVAGRPTITAEATPRVFDRRVFRTRVGLSFELQELGRGAERYVLEVDTQTGVLLEAVAFFNGEPFHKVTTVEIAFDRPIPDERFRFQPPPSVRNPTIGGLPAPQYLSLPEAQRRTPFTVLVPAQLPGDWHVHCTYFERAEGRWAPHVSVQYGSADGHEDVSLWQCPANERPSVEQVTSGRRWEEVVRDGLVVRVTNVASRQGPKAVAHVERDDTFVVLASSKFTSEQLATIAASLKPA